MSKTVPFTIQIDPMLKQQTEKIFQDMGLTPSQAITLFYTQVSLQHALPFQISLPNDATLLALDDLEHGRNTKTFNDVDELLKDLQKDS